LLRSSGTNTGAKIIGPKSSNPYVINARMGFRNKA